MQRRPPQSAQDMSVITLIRSEGQGQLSRIFAAATLAGLANALILALINLTDELIGNGEMK